MTAIARRAPAPRITLARAARYTVDPPLPHQLAAWNWLDERLTEAERVEFAEMFRAEPAVKEPLCASHRNPLRVPYFHQLDNGATGWRECFSSSCAMVAAYHGKVRTDDEYNRIRQRYGDTTIAAAHIATLNALGLCATYHQNADDALLESEIDAGRPVAVGWLHNGTPSAPTGGHWSVVVGYTKTHFIHNDPRGEADLVRGGFVSSSGGKGVAYSRRNWLRRWEVDGPATGWCITVAP